MIEVYENFLNKKEADKIYNIHTSEFFPWYYMNHTSLKQSLDSIDDDNLKNKVIDNFQFYHTFYRDNKQNSDFYKDIMTIIKNKKVLKIKNMRRIKSNLNTNLVGYNKTNIQIPHYDVSYDEMQQSDKLYYSLLYYINDSDGDTIFYNNNYNEIFRTSPKKGKAVLFNSSILHCACNPIKNNKRLVTNFIFEVNNA